jgi:hypothetical protein
VNRSAAALRQKKDASASNRENVDLAEDDHEVRTNGFALCPRPRWLAGGAMFLYNRQHITGKKEKNPRSLAREFPRAVSGPARRIMTIKAGHTLDGMVLERGGGLTLEVLTVSYVDMTPYISWKRIAVL